MINKTRITFISDTHGYHNKIMIPKCDILVVSGDLSSRGEHEVFKSFNKLIGSLKEQNIIKEALVIPGNHDLTLDTNRKNYIHAVKQSIFNNCNFVIHDNIEILGWKFFASAYTPEFGYWAFSFERGNEAQLKWLEASLDSDIFVTHGPPYGILDKTFYGKEHVGCKDLLDKVEEVKPLIHSFGHIHEAYGKQVIDNTLFINASSCTLQYKPTNKAHVVDVWKDIDNNRFFKIIE